LVRKTSIIQIENDRQNIKKFIKVKDKRMKISRDVMKVPNARNKDRIAKIWHQMHIIAK